MAAELPRPGVEVIQVFRSVSPTIITPTLPPCCVGVCRQVVDVLSPNAAGGNDLNNDALVALPAGFVAKTGLGSPALYGGLDGLPLVLSINNAPDLTVTFVGASLSPAQVVAQILAVFRSAGVTAATAEVVGTTRWRLRTVGANEFQSILIVGSGVGASAPAVLAAFGLGADRLYQGAGGYAQSQVVINTPGFPDPRRNLKQIVIEPDTVRGFLYLGGTGGSLSELKRDRAFLRNGFSAAGAVVGTADLSLLTWGGSATVNTKTLLLTVDGGAPLTVTFATPANVAAALAQINAIIGAAATATLDSASHLAITSLSTGPAATIAIQAGTANTNLGLTPGTSSGAAAIKAVDSGSGAAVTPLLQAPGQNFTTATTAAAVTGTTVVSSGVPDGQTLTVDDGSGPQTLTFAAATTGVALLTQVNGVFGTGAGGFVTATLNGSSHLVLTHQKLGGESVLRIVGGTALTTLGLTAATVRGGVHPAKAGDDLYIDGLFYATITQVASGGNPSQLKIDHQVPINPNLGSSFYIVARGLPAAGRPTADLVVDASGNLTVRSEVLRDVQGVPVASGKAQLFVAYHAIRQDVSALSADPALLRFNDTVALGSQLGPVTADNPLALGLYFALLNAPGTQVTGLGVDAASGGAPFGTAEAFARAATFLEGYEVYGVVPLTHDTTVAQIFDTHVSVMSSPENKGERVCLFNPAQPTAKRDALIGSGLNGNSLSMPNTFDTGIANLGALLLAKGVSPVGALSVTSGVYLDVADGKKYPITNIAGPIVTVTTTGFASGENDDGYFSVTALSASLIAQPFAVRLRGARLVLSDGTPDKDGLAVTYQEMAQGYLNRRFWQILPGNCAATLSGIEQVIDGFYLAAAVSGMIAKQPPQQSFTNFPMTGFTRVLGSNDSLSEKQLNICAAGGNYVIVQDAVGTPLIARMALTTDMTSIETRTDSITKVVDFTAKFLRRGLKNFIGRFNITQGFLDSLGHVIQGLLGFLTESGVLIGAHLNNIIQDESAPDTVLIDVTLDVPFPCNYIRLTLVI